jgi:hypothetical protein
LNALYSATAGGGLTVATAGYSLLASAKICCASSEARYSRKRTALSRFGAWRATPAPEMLTCVPTPSWSGNTSATLSTTALSSAASDRIIRRT